MEIFNLIINTLTTSNSSLITIVLVILTPIESYFILLLFHLIFNLKSTTKQKVTYILLAFIVFRLTLFLIPEPYNVFANYILNTFLIYIIFRPSILISIGCSVIPAFIFNLITLLLLNPFISVLNISSDILSEIPIYRFTYILCSYFLITLSIFFLKYLNYTITILEHINLKTKIMLYLTLFFGFLAMFSKVTTFFYYVDVLHVSVTFLGFISLIAFFFISLSTIMQIFKLNTLTQKLASAESYITTLTKLHDQVRGFKHDFDNTLTTIGGYIMTQDLEGLKQYYSDLALDAHSTNTLYILDPTVINNDGIYHLLVTKYYEAELNNINVTITFLLDLSTLRMKIYEFARILGILLDNAIEASAESDKKTLNIIFRHDFTSDTQIITIENSFKNQDIDLEKIYHKGVSSKNSHTGLGLWEVKNIIDRYKDANIKTYTKDSLFIQQIELLQTNKELLKI